jgi:uncharacterized protein
MSVFSDADVTPLVPSGAKLVQSYGDGGFKIAGERVAGSVVIFPTRVLGWSPTAPEHVSLESLADVTQAEERVGILLVGCGRSFVAPPKGLRAALKSEAGIVLEWMDTGAACRTFNVLLGEGRDIAAAVLAVD